MFETADGKTFHHRITAERYQSDIDAASDATERLKRGESVATILRAHGMTVPDEILERVTKDSRLCIPHWQCRDTPGYKPQFFETGFCVYVWGDAGRWSGSYGNRISLTDLAGYANDKRSVLEAPPAAQS